MLTLKGEIFSFETFIGAKNFKMLELAMLCYT